MLRDGILSAKNYFVCVCRRGKSHFVPSHDPTTEEQPELCWYMTSQGTSAMAGRGHVGHVHVWGHVHMWVSSERVREIEVVFPLLEDMLRN